MTATTRQRHKSLARTFRGKVLRSCLMYAVLAVCAFGWTTDSLLDACAERSLTDIARFCAQSLEPGRDGDLSGSVADLQTRYARLIAVATLNGAGQLEKVFPDRPAHRAAALAVLDSRVRSARVPSPLDGEPMTVAGAVVPLNGSESSDAQQALILLEPWDTSVVWRRNTALFAALLAAGGLALAGVLGRWFDHHIVSCLRYLARVVEKRPACPAEVATIKPWDWSETIQITEGVQELVDEIANTNARVRRAKRESEKELCHRKRGFDQALRRARDKATVDALTRLRNRAFFEERLEPFFTEHQDSERDLAAVMIDVDNFKEYNDRHGHQLGDELLQFVGALLRGAVRPEDYAIRYGGDEFLLLLTDTGTQQARVVAERLVRLFAQRTRQLERQHSLSLSIGVATIRAHGAESGHDLVTRADQALYLAKREGKNAVATYPRGRRKPDRAVGRPTQADASEALPPSTGAAVAPVGR